MDNRDDWVSNAVLVGFIALLITNTFDQGLTGGEGFGIFFILTYIAQWLIYLCKKNNTNSKGDC